MSTAVFCTAKDYGHACRIVDRLVNGGFSHNDISVLMPETAETKQFAVHNQTKVPEGTATGAGTGAAIGAGLGWLAGIGALAIPGLGPLIAAGPIMGALGGAAVVGTVGGLVGGLVGMGIPEYEAKRYQDRVKSGYALISVHSDDSSETAAIKEIFESEKAEDISAAYEAAVSNS